MQLQYFRPEELNTALKWLSESKAKVAAGCTDLFPATTSQQLNGPVLDITAIEELRDISDEGDHMRFGAATTWNDVTRANLPAAFDSLKLAALEVGSIQIQNAGTLAGNLCNASPAADGVPCWLTLDAEVELQSVDKTRVLPLSSFITGPRKTELSPDEIVTAILVPKSATEGRSTFLKLGARKYLIISIAMVAARLVEQDGVISTAAISVGSCNAVATRLTEVEEFLVGKPMVTETMDAISAEMIESVLHPIDDLRSDAEYRKTAAVEMVRRCLQNLIANQATAA